MSRKIKQPPASTAHEIGRLPRLPSLKSQVEKALRSAIEDGRFHDGKLPTEVDLAEQFGVSRETVRLAADALEREGLLRKIRRRGTFVAAHVKTVEMRVSTAKFLGYVQLEYPAGDGPAEAVTRTISGLMLQGAIEESTRAGYQLVVQHAAPATLRATIENVRTGAPLRGVIYASCGDEKLVKRMLGLGLPTVLLDHDMSASPISSVRDDSFAGARDAVCYLATLGHRRIGFVNWQRQDLNPWRLQGYRQGLRDSRLSRRRSWELQAEITEAGAATALDAWEADPNRPTALYCFNNTLARFICNGLRDRGERIPEDVSVIGGGGEEVEGLTCHQCDWPQLGRVAVQMLLRNVAADSAAPPEHCLLPLKLYPGRTTGAPNG
jgi:DNA-binding LacI/PurR family transcriptional regulator